MQRPDFDSIKDFSEFSKYYWYREELIKICKAHGLKNTGSKIELNSVIENYFQGIRILPETNTPRRKRPVVTELTPDTGILECGFTFGNRFREYFAEQTGVRPFKFNVDMVATVKEVKRTGDETFTIGDLLDIYYGTRRFSGTSS